MSRIKRTIDTTIGVREFAFTRMFTITGVRYQVSVVNVGNVHTFNMEVAEGAWRIRRSTPPRKLPDWITLLEDDLSKIVMSFTS
jgi:hypothetical protein